MGWSVSSSFVMCWEYEKCLCSTLLFFPAVALWCMMLLAVMYHGKGDNASAIWICVSIWLCDAMLSGLTSWMYFKNLQGSSSQHFTYRNIYLKIQINNLFTYAYVVSFQFAATICYRFLTNYFIVFAMMLHINQPVSVLFIYYSIYYCFEWAFICIF